MGEAILIKALGGGSGGGSSSNSEIYYFTINTPYVVPKTGNYRITCIGGGGASNNSRHTMEFMISRRSNFVRYVNGNIPIGHPSGCFNTKEITLSAGTTYQITIGEGFTNADYWSGNGGTSSFGDVVYASGGTWAVDSESDCKGGNMYSYLHLNFNTTSNYETSNINAIVTTDNYAAIKPGGTAEFGRGRRLFIKGANVSNAPKDGYTECMWGAGGNINCYNRLIYGISDNSINTYFGASAGFDVWRDGSANYINTGYAHSYGMQGCVIVEFVN